MESIEVSQENTFFLVICRIYHEFIKTTSIRSTSLIMIAHKGKRVDAQLETLRKAKFFLYLLLE